MRLCCHPDDPPVPLLGLPRIMSTEADFKRMVDAVDSPANGITFCTGSLGARADNDLPGMVERLGSKIHFLHLRNVRHQKGPGDAPYTSFFESDHLDGNVDMVAVIRAVLAEEHAPRRRGAGRCRHPDAPRPWPRPRRRPQARRAAGLPHGRPHQGPCRTEGRRGRAEVADMRLSAATPLPAGVRGPGYDRDATGFGIVHIGIGAFHKAHQSLYTEAALEAEGGDWRTIGVSLRRPDAAEALNPQDGLYTVLTRGDDTPPRVVGNLGPVLGPLAEDRARILARLTDPATRLVTLTVTEKGYGRGPGGGLDETDPAVAADLSAQGNGIPAPQSVPGLLASALLARRAAGAGPLTVLSCDNLSGNGLVLRGLVETMAGDSAVEAEFPASMVDRITPASTETTYADAADALGVADHAAVETEPFTQFVVEDRFAAGRPAWEAGGAVFVADVAPHEMMKLRMLNGAHSLIAYMGQLHGIDYVRDVVADPALAARVEAHFEAARKTLPEVPGVDLAAYARALMARFANRAILHKTRQIAMDGTEKLPQRIFAPAEAAAAAGGDIAPFAYATGQWMAYAVRAAREGSLDDPRKEALAAAGDDPAAIVAVARLPKALADGPFMAEAVRAFEAAR